MGRGSKRVTEVHTTLRPTGEGPKALSFTAANFQMLGMREEQQDAFALINALDKEKAARKGLLAVVADGMGGMENGGDCAREAVGRVVKYFGEAKTPDMELYSKYVQDLSRELYTACGGQSGSTLVMAVVQGEQLHWLSVGDSSIYRMRGGRLIKLNTAHNLRTQTLMGQIEAHAFDRDVLNADPDGPRLTSFLGMEVLSQTEYTRRPLRLCVGDTLLLCSDGVDGVVDAKRLSRLLEYPPERACQMLREEIILFNSPVQDNCTALIIQFGEAENDDGGEA